MFLNGNIEVVTALTRRYALCIAACGVLRTEQSLGYGWLCSKLTGDHSYNINQ